MMQPMEHKSEQPFASPIVQPIQSYRDAGSSAQGTGSLFGQPLMEEQYRPEFYAYYYKQWHHYSMAYHQHPSTEIMYMISGHCLIELQIQQDAGASALSAPVQVQLKKGQFIMIDANVPHRLIVEGESPCRMLNVEFGFAPSSLQLPSLFQMAGEEEALAELLSQPQHYFVLSDPEEVYYVLKSLVLELDQQHRTGTMADLLFIQLLVRIARLWQDTQIHSTSQTEWYVKRSIQYIHQNYDRPIRVEHIASAVNVHPGYLHRIFKKHMNTTPTDYLTRLRMEKAVMLLGQTDIPIQEIADYIGVSSRQYFHLLFKKHTGQTPAEYRGNVVRYDRQYVEE